VAQTTVDVVIAGAGPTGLLLAIETALAGARVALVERRLTPDDTIKAGGIGALAAEALERRGLGPALDSEEATMTAAMERMFKELGGGPSGAGPPPWQKIGGHFAGLFLIDQTRQEQPNRRLRGVKQFALEQMLEARARELGVEVRRGWSLLGFSESEDGIWADVEGPAGAARLQGRYLVGCDGGRSPVRKHADFSFPGTGPTLTGHQAIVEIDHPQRLLPLGWRRTPAGMMAFGPVPGRIFLAEFDGPPVDRDVPITRGDLETRLRRVSGADVRIQSIQSATRFTDNARQAETYRRGRLLLAGDAAHVHSPFGGQGLNLGLLDAVNLGWKLSAVIRGELPATILDTYTAERHPVAARVLANTRAQVALMRSDGQTSALREIVADLMGLDEGNRFFGAMMSGLKTRYDLGDNHPLVGTLSDNRAIETSQGTKRLFEVMQDGRGVLIDATCVEVSRIAAPWSQRLNIIRSSKGPSLFLRPDACIAWASDDDDIQGLQGALERWLGIPSDGCTVAL
jgi:2-polyprenyl-6-methoxyphenol hydroxylase-like FAD-dependent oxidoreductase